MMPANALLLVLAASTLHALWNVLVAGSRDTQAATAAALAVSLVAFAPIAAGTWRIESRAVPFIAASAALELGYFALLALAYARAELSLVYPFTRGLAPILVLAVSVLALGAGSGPGEAAGVVLVAIGIVLVRGGRGRVDRGTITLVLAIAGTIAGYTLVDRYGIRHANALPYLEVVLVLPAILYTVSLGVGRTRAALTWRTAAAGLAMFGAYALVLTALRLASAASVAAVRETSIVLAVALAAIVLKEPVGRRRYAGAALVATGIATIALA